MADSILTPTGTPISHTKSQQAALGLISERYSYKNDLKLPRVMQLREQAEFMENMMPYYQKFASWSAKSRGVHDRQIYTSGLLHTTWNQLSYGSVKMFPDFIEFTPERTMSSETSRVEATNSGYIVNLARKKGGYINMVKQAQRDLVRGECYFTRTYLVNQEGLPVRFQYQHLPWENVYHEMGDTDTLIVADLSAFQFANMFGVDLLKKVSFGKILSGGEDGPESFTDKHGIKGVETKQNRIQVVTYIDYASRQYYIVMGGNRYFHTELTGKNYPFTRMDGTAFNPVKRRTFYPETPGGTFNSYGPMDMLIPLARLENNIVNSTAIRAIKAAARPVMMYSNDPTDAAEKYDQFLNEVSQGHYEKPFFVQDSATGTTMKPAVIDEGVDNSNMQFWTEFFLDQATQRTRINFRALTELAPTGIQDELRIQIEETANKIVLKSNADVDADFAMEDLYLLKSGDSEFHKLKLFLRVPEEALGAGADTDELRGEGGEIVPVPKTVREFMGTLKDPVYNVSARVDGVFDNKTAVEIRALEKAMMLFQGSPAGAKVSKIYADEVIPEAGVTAADFSMEAPQKTMASGGGIPDGGSLPDMSKLQMPGQ